MQFSHQKEGTEGAFAAHESNSRFQSIVDLEPVGINQFARVRGCEFSGQQLSCTGGTTMARADGTCGQCTGGV